MAYQPKRVPEQLTIQVRTLQYRVYRWGGTGSRTVFILHGWADTGRSFQFLVDALPEDWSVIAPDWRGFGNTSWDPGGYWFPDYLADLDVLLDHFSPQRPVVLIGHSMGGNVAMLYAGIQPERVSDLISLEQFGLRDSDPAEAPARYAQWLQQLRESPVNSVYPGTESMARRLQMLAPRLADDHAAYLAPHWCRAGDQGGFVSLIDPVHKRVNPVLYRRQEAIACWRNISARMMLALGRESDFYQRYQEDEVSAEFRACFDDLYEVLIDDCGHMMHLDQPQATAAAISDFMKHK